jgi:hypothetical protein
MDSINAGDIQRIDFARTKLSKQLSNAKDEITDFQYLTFQKMINAKDKALFQELKSYADKIIIDKFEVSDVEKKYIYLTNTNKNLGYAQCYLWCYYDKSFSDFAFNLKKGDFVEIEAKIKKISDETDTIDAQLLKISIAKKTGCFIATACYGDYNSVEVTILKKYRDENLKRSEIGRQMIKFYYFLSPPIANYLGSVFSL